MARSTIRYLIPLKICSDREFLLSQDLVGCFKIAILIPFNSQ